MTVVHQTIGIKRTLRFRYDIYYDSFPVQIKKKQVNAFIKKISEGRLASLREGTQPRLGNFLQ